MTNTKENMVGKQITRQFYGKFSRRFEEKTVEIIAERFEHGTIRVYDVKFLKSGRIVTWNADVADSYEGWK